MQLYHVLLQIIRALFFAINELEALAEKGNQGLAWSEEEDSPARKAFQRKYQDYPAR